MKNDVKLKVAAEEIKDILRKFDIAGAITLHAPGHGEYFLHLNPSYSCAYMHEDDQIRFFSKIKNYVDKETAIKHQTDTANMLHILTQVTAINFTVLEQLSETLDDEIGAIHG